MHPEAYAAVEKFYDVYLGSIYNNKWDTGAHPRVLDVGSYDVNGTVRPIFSTDDQPWDYLGLDQTEGPNVDRVIPCGKPWSWVDYFDCIVTVSALEHDPRWWETLHHMAQALKVGGYMCICAPSRGDYHGYPQDYYRFFIDVWQSFDGYKCQTTVGCTEGCDYLWNGRLKVLDTWYAGGYYNDAIGVFQKKLETD